MIVLVETEGFALGFDGVGDVVCATGEAVWSAPAIGLSDAATPVFPDMSGISCVVFLADFSGDLQVFFISVVLSFCHPSPSSLSGIGSAISPVSSLSFRYSTARLMECSGCGNI